MSDFEMPVKETKAKSKVSQMTEAAEAPVADKEKPAEKEKPKHDPEELLRIFDEMLFAGSYSEVVTIRGRLKVSFITRTTEQMDWITQKIDTTSAILMATLVEKRSLLNLYYALTSYQGTDLSTLKYEEKVSFINKLPAAIVGMLMVALFDFDTKVNAATREGEENF
jgi:hypothetical protein